MQQERIFGLDLLRAYAILSVVYMHAYSLTDRGIPLALYELPAADGVAVFFVLSGFLIGRILIDTFESKTASATVVAGFWIRRWFRTLPNYYLVLTGLTAYALLQGQMQLNEIWQYFVFSQNLFSVHPAFFPEAWSLSVEEWFYLLLPLVLWWGLRRFSIPTRSVFLWTILLSIGLVTLLRVWKAYHFGYLTVEAWDDHLRKQVITRLDSLMYGVLGAYLSIYFCAFWERISKPALIVGIALQILARVYYATQESIWFLNYLWLSIMAISTLLVLPYLSNFRPKLGYIGRCITFISLISYSMYLLNHTVVLEIILPKLQQSLGLSFFDKDQSIVWVHPAYLLYWMLTIGLSWALYEGFERRATRLREPFLRYCNKRWGRKFQV